MWLVESTAAIALLNAKIRYFCVGEGVWYFCSARGLPLRAGVRAKGPLSLAAHPPILAHESETETCTGTRDTQYSHLILLTGISSL